MWAVGDWKGEWADASSSRQSSLQNTNARPSPSTDATSLYDGQPHHPQPAHSFYVDQPQGGHPPQSSHSQYLHDPRLHGNVYMQQTAPGMHQGIGQGGGYHNPAVGPFNPASFQPPLPPPGLPPPSRRRAPPAPRVLQRIPQVDPLSQPPIYSGKEDAVNPMWTHIYPPEGASAYGHPTIVHHNLQPAITIRDPDEAESSKSAAKRQQVGLPPGLPIPQHALEQVKEDGVSFAEEPQTIPLDKYVGCAGPTATLTLGPYLYPSMAQITASCTSHLHTSSPSSIPTARLCCRHPTSETTSKSSHSSRKRDFSSLRSASLRQIQSTTARSPTDE